MQEKQPDKDYNWPVFWLHFFTRISDSGLLPMALVLFTFFGCFWAFVTGIESADRADLVRDLFGFSLFWAIGWVLFIIMLSIHLSLNKSSTDNARTIDSLRKENETLRSRLMNEQNEIDFSEQQD